VLVALVAVVWKLVAPSEHFLPEFTRLLTEPTIQRGVFTFLSGRSYASGKFKDRDVAIRLQLRRSRHDLGYLVIAVRTRRQMTVGEKDIAARARDEAGRRALDTLADHDLRPSVEEGWLKVLWKPLGFFIFPGRFSEEKWRQVLEALHALATSLDGSAKNFSAEVS
jgi:hypothetical protein